MNQESINRDIRRQLINPSLERSFCESVIQTLNDKSASEKARLLETLQESMDIFKQKAKSFKAPEFYRQMCDKIKDKIHECETLFDVTLGDILALVNGTGISITDVAADYLSPQDIAEVIDEKVIGQEEYTHALALCVYLQVVRAMHQDTELPKRNLLVYGPTGVGKTYSIQVLAKMMNVEFQTVNCNTLVQEGIIGPSISDALTHAYIRNKDFTDICIFFDEVDKLFKDGYYNERILQELLAYLDDDGEVSFATKFGNTNVTYKKFPTRNIMVVLGGVFDMLKGTVAKRVFPNKVGFTSKQKPQDADFYDYVKKEDFAEIFKNDELVGRIGQFVRVRPMTRDMMRDILKSETASPIIPFVNFFDKHGMTVTLTDDGAERILDTVLKEKLGVRGLKSVLGTILQDDMARVKHTASTSVVIDDEYVTRHLPESQEEAHAV